MNVAVIACTPEQRHARIQGSQEVVVMVQSSVTKYAHKTGLKNRPLGAFGAPLVYASSHMNGKERDAIPTGYEVGQEPPPSCGNCAEEDLAWHVHSRGKRSHAVGINTGGMSQRVRVRGTGGMGQRVRESDPEVQVA
eukprot:360269-Chlamydomonas_euryale.AAC.5